MDMREASAMMEASGREAADGMLAKDGTREFPEGVMQAHDA